MFRFFPWMQRASFVCDFAIGTGSIFTILFKSREW
jgi:hypothetical protein